MRLSETTKKLSHLTSMPVDSSSPFPLVSVISHSCVATHGVPQRPASSMPPYVLAAAPSRGSVPKCIILTSNLVQIISTSVGIRSHDAAHTMPWYTLWSMLCTGYGIIETTNHTPPHPAPTHTCLLRRAGRGKSSARSSSCEVWSGVIADASISISGI